MAGTTAPVDQPPRPGRRAAPDADGAVSHGQPSRMRPARTSRRLVLLLVSVVATVCLVGAATVVVQRLEGRDHVVNGDARYDLTGWEVASDAGRTSLDRMHIEDGPEGHDTAALIDRNGEGFGDWARALVTIDHPTRSLTVGKTYTLRALVRNRGDSRQTVGLLLANGNYAHRPTEASVYDTVPPGAGWHELVITFICTAEAQHDTAVYLALPRSGATHWSITGVSLRAGSSGGPGDAGPTAYRQAPDRVLRFEGPDGAAPDAGVWSNELGGNGWGNKELQTYTEGTQNAALDGRGNLVITARREDAVGLDGITRHYTSARLTTHGKLEVAPGSYLEASVRAPVGIGVWPAFWLLGSNIKTVGWPTCGELDILEVTGSNPTTALSSLHMADTQDPRRDRKVGGGDPGGKTVLPHALDTSSHVYGVYFDRSKVVFYIDHRPTLTYTAVEAAKSGRAWPFAQSQSIILNVAIDSAFDPTRTSFPRAMTVGPISVWDGRVPF